MGRERDRPSSREAQFSHRDLRTSRYHVPSDRPGRYPSASAHDVGQGHAACFLSLQKRRNDLPKDYAEEDLKPRPAWSQRSANPSSFPFPCTFFYPLAPEKAGSWSGTRVGSWALSLFRTNWRSGAPPAPLNPGPFLSAQKELRLQKYPGWLQPGHSDHRLVLILPEKPTCG